MLRNYNLGNTPNSNRIEAIKTTPEGEKLIAFSRVINYPKCKPQVSPCVFAVYKNGLLSIYNRNDFSAFNLPTFKEALIFIRTFTDYSYNHLSK